MRSKTPREAYDRQGLPPDGHPDRRGGAVQDDCLTEWCARFSAALRGRVEGMRACGEAEPVALFAAGGHELGRRLRQALGDPELPEASLGPMAVLPKARAIGLLNECVSAGLGTRLIGVPISPEHAFRLVGVCPGRLDMFVVAFEGCQLRRVASLALDLATRALTVNVEGDPRDQFQIDW